MGQSGFEESRGAAEPPKDTAEDQAAISGEPKIAGKKRKSSRNQEWAGDIVANGYFMILYG